MGAFAFINAVVIFVVVIVRYVLRLESCHTLVCKIVLVDIVMDWCIPMFPLTRLIKNIGDSVLRFLEMSWNAGVLRWQTKVFSSGEPGFENYLGDNWISCKSSQNLPDFYAMTGSNHGLK
jgi:hypothetical protein